MKSLTLVTAPSLRLSSRPGGYERRPASLDRGEDSRFDPTQDTESFEMSGAAQSPPRLLSRLRREKRPSWRSDKGLGAILDADRDPFPREFPHPRGITKAAPEPPASLA